MLNKEQKEAVEILNQPLVLIAGPGTGKTLVISHKISNILKQNKAKSEEILALTFTQKAAEEMSQRVKEITGKPFEAKTFHSFALEIIEEYQKFICDIDKGFTIIDENDQLLFFMENLDKFKVSSIEIKNNHSQIARELQATISRLKDFNIKIKDLEKEDIDIQTKVDLMSAYSKYEIYKKENNFLDFADILICIKDTLEKDEKLKEEIKSKYKYFLIDEFQDTNKIQLDLIKLMANENITIVGDQKQSIYSFRGANYRNLDEFKKHFNPKEIYLKENYRSSREVIETVNKLSSKEEQVNANVEEKGKVELYNCLDELCQEALILERISEIQEKDKEANIGILSRRKQELFELSLLLKKFGIKHSLGSLNNIFENQFVQEIIHILTIVNKPKDSEIELFHILNQLSLKELTIRKITNKKSSILEAIKDSPSEEESENESLKELSKKLEFLIKLKESKTKVDEIILKITSTFKYYEKALLNSDYESIASMNAFIEYSKSFSKTYKTANLSKFLDICRYSKSLNLDFEEDTEDSKIQLITIHQSKGKEYDYVFLPFLNDRKFPGQFRQTIFKTRVDLSREESLEEEKRLLFVALSRAKKDLILSYVKKYSQNILESKASSLIENLKLNVKDYNTKFPDYNPDTKENLKLEIIKKISEQLLDNQFKNAKKEIDVLSSMFGKKDLNSFLNPELSNSIDNYKKKIENKEKLNINPKSMVYSVSQIQTYDSCPKKYMYQYVYKIPTQPKHYFDFGTTMHSVLENLTPKFLEGLSEKELEEIAIEDMHKNWISKAYESISQEEEYKKKGEEAIKNFIKKQLELSKEQRETIKTEEKFELEIEGKRFIGYIDRIDKLGEKIEIMDYKTSNSMETEKKLVDNIQLGVYALAIKNIYKKFPDKVALWYLIHDKILALEFDKHNLEGTKQKIIETTNKIEEGDFTAKPSNFACRFCDFNKICDKSLF